MQEVERLARRQGLADSSYSTALERLKLFAGSRKRPPASGLELVQTAGPRVIIGRDHLGPARASEDLTPMLSTITKVFEVDLVRAAMAGGRLVIPTSGQPRYRLGVFA